MESIFCKTSLFLHDFTKTFCTLDILRIFLSVSRSHHEPIFESKKKFIFQLNRRVYFLQEFHFQQS